MIVAWMLVATLAASPPADPLEGVWRGTSICQIRSSPCKDEQVVYHIARSASARGYRINMNKLVAGAEEEMGALDARFDPALATLQAETLDRQGRTGRWVFKLTRGHLSGRLLVSGGTLYRLIEVSRQSPR